MALAVAASVLAVGCGGGSSGTGDSSTGMPERSEPGSKPPPESVGQLVDISCRPLAGVDLSSLGLATIEPVPGEDGSFTLNPNMPQQIPGQGGGPPTQLDSSQASCIVIVYDQGAVVSTHVYRRGDLPECSVEGLVGIVPQQDLPACADSTAAPNPAAPGSGAKDEDHLE